MSNPFDPRAIFHARHAQHVVLIHFPIALFLIGVLLDLLARVKRDSRLATAAQMNLTASAFCIFPAYVTGLLAWRFALEGQQLKGVLLYHLLLASASMVLIVAAWWLRSRTQLRSIIPLLVELAGALSISLTAHLGGFLSGVNT